MAGYVAENVHTSQLLGIQVGMKSAMFIIPELCVQFPMFYSQVCVPYFVVKTPSFRLRSDFVLFVLKNTAFSLFFSLEIQTLYTQSF